MALTRDVLCRGHEGKGSVLALLKIKGWAQELSAGFSCVYRHLFVPSPPTRCCRYSLNEFAVFKCTIKLTDAGVQRWEDAVALVLDYLRTMRNAEEDKLRQLYDEQTAIDSADFQFQSRQTEETYADKLSNALLLYPADLVLCARNCCVEPIFDYGVFKQLLEYFNCGNMRVHVTAPLSQQPDPHLPWLRAPWYGTQYRVSSLIDSFELCLGAKLATDNDLQAALEVATYVAVAVVFVQCVLHRMHLLPRLFRHADIPSPRAFSHCPLRTPTSSLASTFWVTSSPHPASYFHAPVVSPGIAPFLSYASPASQCLCTCPCLGLARARRHSSRCDASSR